MVRALQGQSTQITHDTPRTAFTGIPGAFKCLRKGYRDHAQQGLPMFTLAQHQGRGRVLAGGGAHLVHKFGINARYIAWQHQQMGVPCHRQAGANTSQRAREVGYLVVHQLVGVGRVLLPITVAGDDQVIGQAARQPVQMADQRLALPLQQTLVLATHALAAPACQQQDGAGR